MTNHYKEPSEAVSKWNPFEDTFTYEPTMEEDLFGAEFDKIRQEGEKNFERHVKTIKSYRYSYNRNTIAGTIARHCNTRGSILGNSILSATAACIEEEWKFGSRWKALHLVVI